MVEQAKLPNDEQLFVKQPKLAVLVDVHEEQVGEVEEEQELVDECEVEVVQVVEVDALL